MTVSQAKVTFLPVLQLDAMLNLIQRQHFLQLRKCLQCPGPDHMYKKAASHEDSLNSVWRLEHIFDFKMHEHHILVRPKKFVSIFRLHFLHISKIFRQDKTSLQAKQYVRNNIYHATTCTQYTKTYGPGGRLSCSRTRAQKQGLWIS